MVNQKQSLLSSEEVEALVEGMASGDVDTTPAPGPAASAVQAYSLVSTDTTTRGQLAALEMINDRMSRQMRGSLLNLLRQAVKLSVNPFEVTTFGSFIQSVQAPCNVNIVRYPPLRGYGLVTIEPSLVYGAVDSFFGGRADGSLDLHPQRGFTPTEERIIQLLLDVVFNDLREAWAPVYALNPEYVSREINPAFAQVGEERETVVVSRFDLELGAVDAGSAESDERGRPRHPRHPAHRLYAVAGVERRGRFATARGDRQACPPDRSRAGPGRVGAGHGAAVGAF